MPHNIFTYVRMDVMQTMESYTLGLIKLQALVGGSPRAGCSPYMGPAGGTPAQHTSPLLLRQPLWDFWRPLQSRDVGEMLPCGLAWAPRGLPLSASISELPFRCRQAIARTHEKAQHHQNLRPLPCPFCDIWYV